MKTLLRTLLYLALIVWLGAEIFFPVVAAITFGTLQGATHTAGTIVGEERVDLGQELIEGRLGLDQQVVPPLEGNEASVGDERSEATSLLERNARVVARMEDERRHVNLRRDVSHIQVPERSHHPSRVLGR